MSRMFKRLAFALSVPAALAVGGWAQWTTLTADDATVAVSTADASRVDVLRERPDTSAADARITSAPVLDRTAGSAAQPPVPPVKANTELAQKKIVTYRIKPAPIPDRTAGSGAQPPVPAVEADTELARSRHRHLSPDQACRQPRSNGGERRATSCSGGGGRHRARASRHRHLSPDQACRQRRSDGGDGAQPPVPAVKADTELAQADAVPYPPIKPAPSPDRTARDGTTGQAEPSHPGGQGRHGICASNRRP